MMIMKTIPTFITNIMPSAEKAPDAAIDCLWRGLGNCISE
jgi:hypothetical protein